MGTTSASKAAHKPHTHERLASLAEKLRKDMPKWLRTFYPPRATRSRTLKLATTSPLWRISPGKIKQRTDHSTVMGLLNAQDASDH
jgi:hypothetical protein